MIEVEARYLEHSGGTKFYESITLMNLRENKQVVVFRWGKIEAAKSGRGETQKFVSTDVRHAHDTARKKLAAKAKNGYSVVPANWGLHDGPTKLDGDAARALLTRHYGTQFANELLGQLGEVRSSKDDEVIVEERPDAPARPEPERSEGLGIVVIPERSNMHEEFTDDTVYGVEMSMGGINAYAHDCTIYQGRPGYAVCLHKIAATERGDKKAVGAKCLSAIGDKVCPAIGMRKQEIDKGQAIFFIHRIKQREHFERVTEERNKLFRPNERYTPKVRAAKSSTKPMREIREFPAEPPARAPAAPASTGNGYADAINAAIREAQTEPKTTIWDGFNAPNMGKPAPAPIPPSAPAPAPQVSAPAAPVRAGMSLIEMARAQLAAKANQTAQGA